MSWDIFVQDLPAGITSVKDFADDYEPAPIGLRSEIIAKISAHYPDCDFADPSWGVLDLPECSIEFNLGDDELMDSFAMHVRGDERAANVVAHILRELDMRAIDVSSDSGLFEQESVLRSESFRRWQSYRNQVVGCRDGES